MDLMKSVAEANEEFDLIKAAGVIALEKARRIRRMDSAFPVLSTKKEMKAWKRKNPNWREYYQCRLAHTRIHNNAARWTCVKTGWISRDGENSGKNKRLSMTQGNYGMTDNTKEKLPGKRWISLAGVNIFSIGFIRDFFIADDCTSALCLWLKALDAVTLHIAAFGIFALVLLINWLRN